MRALDDLSRDQLAEVGREYMLFGHLLNRAALPHVHFQVGADAQFLVQNHLLVRALMLSVAARADDDVAGRIATAQ